MRPARDRATQAGYTLVELLAYLAVFVSLTGTIVGAEIFARKLNRSEAATLEALYEVDRAFAAIAEDCDRARAVHFTPEQPGGIAFEGASAYVSRDGEVLRDGKRVARATVEFSRPDAEKHPHLVRVKLLFRKDWGPKDWFERTYIRTFYVRNLGGGARRGDF